MSACTVAFSSIVSLLFIVRNFILNVTIAVTRTLCVVGDDLIEVLLLLLIAVITMTEVLDVFVELRKVSVSFIISVCLSVRLSVHIEQPAPTRRILLKIHIYVFFADM
jgi:hypothetical protein